MSDKLEHGGGKALTIRQKLEGPSFLAALKKVLPKHLPPQRFVRVALTAIQKTPGLAECEPASFFNSLMTLSELGLEPDGRRAYLIPFKNTQRGVMECQLIIGYKGLNELILDNGDAAVIHADVVCEGEEFVFNRGLVERHVIDLANSTRGTSKEKVLGAYVIIRLASGAEKCEVMATQELENVRVRSKAVIAAKKYGKKTPWDTDTNEMRKKTVLRRASKWVKLSPKVREALEKDFDRFEDFNMGGEGEPPPTPLREEGGQGGEPWSEEESRRMADKRRMAEKAQGAARRGRREEPMNDEQEPPPPEDDGDPGQPGEGEYHGEPPQREPGQDVEEEEPPPSQRTYTGPRKELRDKLMAYHRKDEAAVAKHLQALTRYRSKKTNEWKAGRTDVNDLTDGEAAIALKKLTEELGG